MSIELINVLDAEIFTLAMEATQVFLCLFGCRSLSSPCTIRISLMSSEDDGATGTLTLAY
jgi:hypothetical protein